MGDWDAELADDEAGAVMRMVGRQLKLWREAAGLTQAEFGTAIGYGEELVSSVERGRRIPRPEYLIEGDRVLNAGGRIAAMQKDVAEARYPKKVRDLKKLEAESVEICAYDNSVVNGLLQTEDYIRAIFGSRRPAFPADQLDRLIAARIGRQSIIGDERTTPAFSFVHDEAALRRPVGGRAVLRKQLQRLLEVGQLRNVEVQVLPLGCEDNAGLDGPFHLLRLKGGTTVGHSDIQLVSRLIAEPKELHILEVRYGIIRAQALSPRESLSFIEKLLGDT